MLALVVPAVVLPVKITDGRFVVKVTDPNEFEAVIPKVYVPAAEDLIWKTAWPDAFVTCDTDGVIVRPVLLGDGASDTVVSLAAAVPFTRRIVTVSVTSVVLSAGADDGLMTNEPEPGALGFSGVTVVCTEAFNVPVMPPPLTDAVLVTKSEAKRS